MTSITQQAPVRAVIDCRIVAVSARGATVPILAGPHEELLLLVGVQFPGRAMTRPSRLTVELYRGDELRDRWENDFACGEFGPDGGSWCGAFVLNRSGRPLASSRLRCRVLLDGHEVAQTAVLLGAPVVDAQGRMNADDVRAASDATLLHYSHDLNRLLRAAETARLTS